MARHTGPKDKLSRREGTDLFGKGNKFTRLNVPPGVHGPKAGGRGGGRGVSEYGKQLREKQKVKRLYGVMEKQFKSYVKKAMKVKGNTEETLLTLLESRLDNVVFRLGFASTRPAARQLVTHGHVLVNNQKLSIPSYQVKPGEVVTLSAKALKMPTVKELLTEKKPSLPAWLQRKAAVGKVERQPKLEDVAEPIEATTILEFYSR